MTEQEAIKELKIKYLGDSYAIVEAKELAITALETISKLKERNMTMEALEEYMKFEDECVKKGFTFKSLLEARERQIPKKIDIRTTKNGKKLMSCPSCLSMGIGNYCSNCGTAIDWEVANA